MSLNCNDKVNSSSKNKNSMEDMIFSSNFTKVNEEKVKETDFILGVICEDNKHNDSCSI